MADETKLCLVGLIPNCGCVAVHCEEFARIPMCMLGVLVESWQGMGLTPDLVDTRLCEQTRARCPHKVKWYHGNSYHVLPETREHTKVILKVIQVMRVLADKPELLSEHVVSKLYARKKH